MRKIVFLAMFKFTLTLILTTMCALAFTQTCTNHVPKSTLLSNTLIHIGVQVDPSEAQRIEHFIAKAKDSSYLNPFLEWEIRVRGVFTHLATNTLVELDGFYYEKYKSFSEKSLPIPANGTDYSDEEYNLLGSYEQTILPYQFAFHFFPEMAGPWTFYTDITTLDKNYQSKTDTLLVELGLPQSYLSIHENRRNLGLNKQVFYPRGLNACWPETYQSFDPELFRYHTYTIDGIQYFKPEYYRNVLVTPRVYDIYRNRLKTFAENGINYVRTIMSPISTEIEWEQLGDYSARMTQAAELDEILRTSEAHKLYLHWNLQIHFTFKYNVYAISQWDWDDSDGSPSYAYKKEFNLVHPSEFFTHAGAKEYYKQRLRYIVARWGYSPQIGAFELMSEINNIGSKDDSGNDFYDQHPEIYSAWLTEMGAYIKSLHYGRRHLLTASYAGAKSPLDHALHSEYFDLLSSNLYDYGQEDGAQFYIDEVVKNYLNSNPETKNSYYAAVETAGKGNANNKNNIKPFLFSESDPLDAINACSGSYLAMNRAIWQGFFSGAAGVLSWSNWYNTNNYGIYGQMAKFIKTFRLEEREFMQAHLEESSAGLIYTPQGRVSDGKSDLIYLRESERKGAIGILSNRSLNDLNGEICQEGPAPTSVNVKRAGYRITGLKKRAYLISYYYPSDFENPIFVQAVKSDKIKLKIGKLGVTESDYLIVFVVEERQSAR